MLLEMMQFFLECYFGVAQCVTATRVIGQPDATNGNRCP